MKFLTILKNEMRDLQISNLLVSIQIHIFLLFFEDIFLYNKTKKIRKSKYF